MNSSISIGTSRKRGMQEFFVGLVGAALMYVGWFIHPSLNIIQETVILVIFLGLLLGIAPLPFPNLSKTRWLYPILAGLLSAFMDSFLVLLLVAAIPLKGSVSHILKFKAYNMIAALIGGLLVYFGEVYALPHYLKYGIHSIDGALFLLPPVLVFLGILGFLVNKLSIQVVSVKKDTGEITNTSIVNRKRVVENIIEFVIGIILLLTTHNALLCLGVLLVYSFISGQGHDLVKVLRHETEMEVMLLLIFAMLIFEPTKAFFGQFTQWWAYFGFSTVNAVISGALLPKEGNIGLEIVLISAGALVTPISSLVGVMLFKIKTEWVAYMKVSLPLTIVWLVLGLSWVLILMPLLGIHMPGH